MVLIAHCKRNVAWCGTLPRKSGVDHEVQGSNPVFESQNKWARKCPTSLSRPKVNKYMCPMMFWYVFPLSCKTAAKLRQCKPSHFVSQSTPLKNEETRWGSVLEPARIWKRKWPERRERCEASFDHVALTIPAILPPGW